MNTRTKNEVTARFLATLIALSNLIMVFDIYLTIHQPREIIVEAPSVEPVVIEKEVTVIDIKEVAVLPPDYDELRALAAERELIFEQEQKRWDELESRYEAASIVWQYLKGLGMNDYVISGILGNMMNECGGNTLNLYVDIYNKAKTHYGLCQWSVAYHPDVKGKDIYNQLYYLVSTLPDVFNVYGYLYKKGFTYVDFCNLQSVDEAADAFRIVYERPGSGTENIRKYNARLAYCTFVN